MAVDIATYEGLFNDVSLTVGFAFTRAAHQAAVEEWGRTRRWGEELRTYFHELTHFIQATTTPYGLFLHYCREVQTNDTIAVVRALLDADIAIKRPLLLQAPSDLTGPTGATVCGGLRRWLHTEILITFLSQDHAKFVERMSLLFGAAGRFAPFSVLETFHRLHGGIGHIISNENSLRDRLGVPPWDNGELDVDAINEEGSVHDNQAARGVERASVAIEMLGPNPWGTESILESAATAVEWAESGADLAALSAYANDNADPELAMYKNCLVRGLEAIKAKDISQFCYTFIALCELALHAPLLPHHVGLRQGGIDPRQLFPSLRFLMLLGAAEKVRPLQDLADVGRYYVEICQLLNWVHPFQMITIALRGPQVVEDQRAQRYIWAQSERAKRLHAFTNPPERELDQGSGGYQFRSRYAFPVIEYSDKTLYMADKNALGSLRMQYIFARTMRQIILGKTLIVECPYRCAPEEAKVLTTDLRNALERIFGRSFPMAKVVMPYSNGGS